MALVTTFMTGPALNLINWAFKSKNKLVPDEINSKSKFKILLFFGNNEKGRSLLRLASSLVKKQKENVNITAMHLVLSDEMHVNNMEEYETDSFLPIINESKILDQQITTVFKATVDVETDIVEIANQGEYDFLLVGLGKSIFEGTLLGILINKDLQTVNKIFIPIFSAEDGFLLDYGQKLIYNNDSKIAVLDGNGQIKNNFIIKNAVDSLENNYPSNISLLTNKVIEKEFLKQHDLMIISLESWKKLVDSQSDWLSDIPSVLIVKP